MFELGAKKWAACGNCFLMIRSREEERGWLHLPFCLRGTFKRRDQVGLPICLIGASCDGFPNNREITDSQPSLIQPEMGWKSLVSLRRAAAPGGDNKKGKQSQGNPAAVGVAFQSHAGSNRQWGNGAETTRWRMLVVTAAPARTTC